MKVLFMAAEAAPFAKTGGLGDVIGSLPLQMAKEGLDVRVIIPWYRDIPEEYKAVAEQIADCTVNVGWREQRATVRQLKYEGVLFYFIDQPYYFDRSGIYGYFDDGERFAFFSQAALAIIEKIDFIPDVIHAHDWHTALVPLYLKDFYQSDESWEKVKSVFTIHNLAYQGQFPLETVGDILGLNWDYCTEEKLALKHTVNLMKGGIIYADAVTTVSETYAKEIQTPERGEGLDEVLREYSGKLYGIVNGINVNSYNPKTDTALSANFDGDEGLTQRQQNKEWLFERCGFTGSLEAPIIGMVSRITWEKGMDLVCEVIPNIVESGAKLVILGTGDLGYEERLQELAKQNVGSMALMTEFNDKLARNIYGGSDIFLMPSIFEPCGISQLLAMRYGAVPLVRSTGGLKDTVQPYDPSTGLGNGFVFKEISREDFFKTYEEALSVYKEKDFWVKLVGQGMSEDHSWSESVKKYINLYSRVIEGGD